MTTQARNMQPTERAAILSRLSRMVREYHGTRGPTDSTRATYHRELAALRDEIGDDELEIARDAYDRNADHLAEVAASLSAPAGGA